VDKMEKTISQMEDRIRNLEIRGNWTLFPKQIPLQWDLHCSTVDIFKAHKLSYIKQRC
jgi:hypothetical protein